jgi:hypothetical protein
VIGSNCVENEVKAIGVLLHLVGIAGDNDFIRTQAKRIILLVSEVVKTTTWAPNA